MEFKVIDHTKEVIAAKDAAVLRALEAIGLQAEGYAKMKCPVDTGLLRNSITHAIKGKPTSITSYKADRGPKSGTVNYVAPGDEDAVYIGTNVEYAPYVEFGTSRPGSAQPFLAPAVNGHLEEYEEIAKSYLSGKK